MADVNIVKLRISNGNGKSVEKQYQFSEAIFELTDDLVKEVMQEKKIENITSCILSVGLYNAALIIKSYSLTKNVYIDGFYNINSVISILQAADINIHIEKQTIDKLQIDCAEVLLADCQVNQFDAGLSKFYPDENNLSNFEFEQIDIRDCDIHFIQMFNNCKRFNVQRSDINILNMNGTMRTKAAVMENLLIWQNSNIGTMTMQYSIKNFKIEESTVSRMVAKTGCYYENTDIDIAGILDSYYFTKENFSQMNVGTWSIVSKSASNQGLLNERAEAQYHIVKESYEQAKGIKKFFGKLIDFCTGYGYKPIRALKTCLLMILVSWGLLESVDVALFRLGNIIPIRSIWDNLFIALTAIIGQSGMTINDGFPYWVSYGEYICAVILFAMFVNALYVRYKD